MMPTHSMKCGVTGLWVRNVRQLGGYLEQALGPRREAACSLAVQRVAVAQGECARLQAKDFACLDAPEAYQKV